MLVSFSWRRLSVTTGLVRWRWLLLMSFACEVLTLTGCEERTKETRRTEETLRTETRPQTTPTSSALRKIPGARGSAFKLTVDRHPFLAAGCVKKDHRSLDCSNAKTIPLVQGEGRFVGKVRCNDQLEINPSLGGLTPKLAIGVCHTPSHTDIARIGCMARLFRRFIVHEAGKFTVIDSAEVFRQRFAPVDSSAEAFSFAIALSTAYPDYQLEVPANFKILVPEIDATFVKQSAAGFVVRLFEEAYCGCGNHETSAVDYLVTKAGQVSMQKRTPVYDDPTDNRRCVD